MNTRTPAKISQKRWEKQAQALLELAEGLAAEDEPDVVDQAQLACDCILLLWPGFGPDQIIRSLRASLAAGSPLVAGPESLEEALSLSQTTVARGVEQELGGVLLPELDDLLQEIRQ